MFVCTAVPGDEPSCVRRARVAVPRGRGASSQSRSLVAKAAFRQGGANQLIFASLRCARVQVTMKGPDTMSVAGSKEGSTNNESSSF
jgi:hypothetical protein